MKKQYYRYIGYEDMIEFKPKKGPVNMVSSKNAFLSHMILEEACELKVNDKIDHRDQVGRFVSSTISEKNGSNLKIHYDGWRAKWDVWSDYKQELYRFAVAGSISKRPRHRFLDLKIGDFVLINPRRKHPGWKNGEIRRFGDDCGQVQVCTSCNCVYLC